MCIRDRYMSAYEPIHDPDKQTIGVLYVGVLKDRYDDMRRQVLAVFIGLLVIGLVAALSLIHISEPTRPY